MFLNKLPIKNSPLLEELSLINCHLNSTDTEGIIDFVGQMGKLQKLDLSQNNFTAESIKEICQRLTEVKKIVILENKKKMKKEFDIKKLQFSHT